eukprot:CAMPEP_0197308786 /NCGR_PEP_ID=MMETSP0891-20130614/7293_1 /TAXON_ID=44058 ORGANISM="Aureoumbra lagunensis, Strain CCMP1510" /NCGR_SAMPLE_ID=MMETSP0891 /ASSEMBLY_ACC=CAM_ASM_000534 /LENGTH=363 /DNA_ID=CAMNT_0042793479 /DNA_START=4171 /DNA_END=5258 /DNA_ORIENTATION=-
MKSGEIGKVGKDLSDEERKKLRAARFAADAEKGAPPIPKRKMAWPGGKIKSNKEEAMAKFERRKQQEEEHVKLYIGNLSYRTNSNDLNNLFFGCTSAKVMTDGRRSRGFGFATFPNEKTAQEAMNAMDGYIHDGRALSVKPATRRGGQAVTTNKKRGWGLDWAGPSSPKHNDSSPLTNTTEQSNSSTRIEKPLEVKIAEPTVVWKLATKKEAEEWQKSGFLDGSSLDKKDNFWHFADAEMVKKVANLFFRDMFEPLVLLAAEPENLPSNLLWIHSDVHSSESELASLVQNDGIPRIRVFDDGCLHLHSKSPLPFATFSLSLNLLRREEKESGSIKKEGGTISSSPFIFPPECTITIGPKPQAL